MLLVKAKWCVVKRQLQKMLKNVIQVVIRRWLAYVKFFGRRRYVLLLPPLVLFLLVMWPTLWWSMTTSNQGGPRVYEDSSTEPAQHFNISRNLEHYLQNMHIVIEPTQTLCDTQDKVLVVILVATTSPSYAQREAVRETWGIFQPTYFLMGRYGDRTKQLVSNRKEATMFNDLIVFEFLDVPANETLKTALMMQWAMTRCPQALFMFKTEQDVMVNPWMLNKVLWENRNAQLIGYSLHDKHETYEFKKGYIQKVLHDDDSNSLKYLSGTGYIIRGDYLQTILVKAYQVPLISLEDVYFTHLVAHKGLGLTLTHDRRLSPYKPWLPIACVYWNQASIHSLAPTEMMNAWYYIEDLVVSYTNLKRICKLYNMWFYIFSDLVLY